MGSSNPTPRKVRYVWIMKRKVMGCDVCAYRNNCQVKADYTPSGCMHLKIDDEIKDYELVVCLKVSVRSDSKENAIKQLTYDKYENSNPCVTILEDKYIGDFNIN